MRSCAKYGASEVCSGVDCICIAYAASRHRRSFSHVLSIDKMAAHLLHDSSRREKYRGLVDDQDTAVNSNTRVNILEIGLPKDHSHFQGPYAYSEDVFQLSRDTKSPIRIIFAPLDYPTAQTANILHAIFDLFSIPTAYLNERVQGVTHSLNFDGVATTSFTCWLHFLCKAIATRPDAPTWHRAGFFLTHDDIGSTHLVCFGASKALVARFQQLPITAWALVCSDPIALLAIVLADLQLTIDEQVWSLNDSVGSYEHHAISTTRSKTAFADDYFQDLHWVAKNVTHLKESADAALNTCLQLREVSRESLNTPPRTTAASTSTIATLTYLNTLFQGSSLRTTSLNSRIQNTINLSFNLVAQSDSNHLRAESSSMHTIALTTLIFLPIATVATVFGSQFFSFNPPDGDAPPPGGLEAAPLVLSKEFWLFWAITVPLTAVVLGVWLGFHPEAVRRWWRRNISRTSRRRRDEEAATCSPVGAGGSGSGSLALQSLSSHGTGASALTASSAGNSTLVNGRSVGR